MTNIAESTGRSAQWTYDGINRLTGEAISGAASANGTVDYSLDPVGNRLSESSSISGLNSGAWGFNADDEVTSETYDANGNTLATGGKTFTYDSQNQMLTMTSGTTAVSMIYDGDGNRVGKSVNGVTTLYLVDTLNPTGYAQVVEELSSAGVVQREYSYGLMRISQQQQLSGAWTPSFYGYDGGWSVRQLTNSTGAVTDTYSYDAFGNLLTHTGTTPNNYLYRGEQYDSDLGLYYLRARYYNPATGRFMSRDPQGWEIPRVATVHRYLFTGGDPVNWIDPTGRLFDTTTTYFRVLATVTAISFVIIPPIAIAYECFAHLVSKWPYETPKVSAPGTPDSCEDEPEKPHDDWPDQAPDAPKILGPPRWRGVNETGESD